MIEELLGASAGIICLEDIIDALVNCGKNEFFEQTRQVLWPIQLASLKEDSTKAHTKHEATGADIKKRNTKVSKGGYLGLMGEQINDFIRPLI